MKHLKVMRLCLAACLGLGVDITLTKTFDVRVSGAVGDYEGVGIGVAWHK